jgi:hypothetical protein
LPLGWAATAHPFRRRTPAAVPGPEWTGCPSATTVRICGTDGASGPCWWRTNRTIIETRASAHHSPFGSFRRAAAQHRPPWAALGRGPAEPGGQQRTAGDNKRRGQRAFRSDSPGRENPWSALSQSRGCSSVRLSSTSFKAGLWAAACSGRPRPSWTTCTELDQFLPLSRIVRPAGDTRRGGQSVASTVGPAQFQGI